MALELAPRHESEALSQEKTAGGFAGLDMETGQAHRPRSRFKSLIKRLPDTTADMVGTAIEAIDMAICLQLHEGDRVVIGCHGNENRPPVRDAGQERSAGTGAGLQAFPWSGP